MIEPASLERTFGASVKSLREGRNWSQAKLAGLLRLYGLSLHQPTIAKIESGQRPVRLKEAATIAVLFEVDLMSMLDVAARPDGEPAVVEAKLRLDAAETAWSVYHAQARELAEEHGRAVGRADALKEAVERMQAREAHHAQQVVQARAEYEAALRQGDRG